jgi:hypothetical protein
MGAVTGQIEVLELARKIVSLCDEHTSSEPIARAATDIAGKVITLRLSSSQSPQELPLSATSLG